MQLWTCGFSLHTAQDLLVRPAPMCLMIRTMVKSARFRRCQIRCHKATSLANFHGKVPLLSYQVPGSNIFDVFLLLFDSAEPKTWRPMGEYADSFIGKPYGHLSAPTSIDVILTAADPWWPEIRNFTLIETHPLAWYKRFDRHSRCMAGNHLSEDNR